MDQQKIVVEVAMYNEKMIRKAKKIAAGISGVKSMRILGQDNEQIEVIGEGIDPIALTLSLRKSVGHAKILSVGIEEKKIPKTDPTTSESETEDIPVNYEYICGCPCPCYYHSLPPQFIQEVPPSDPCTIM